MRGCVYPAVGLPGAGGGQGGAEAAIHRGGDGGSLQRTSEATSKLILRRQACIIAKNKNSKYQKCENDSEMFSLMYCTVDKNGKFRNFFLSKAL